ncbi:MAG: carboxypeptidase-like regulatory domain-containing protein [Flavobacteriaceae bacterium]
MKKLIFFLALIGFSSTALAQKSVSGQVLEKGTDLPLLGVSILVKGTTIGTSTDFDGNYTLEGL